MNVKEAPIDNRQEHLDLLCFPTLFPTESIIPDRAIKRRLYHLVNT